MTKPTPLSPRQLEIIRMMSFGKRDKEIASKLGISEETVGVHIQRAIKRMGASTRCHAACLFGLHRM